LVGDCHYGRGKDKRALKDWLEVPPTSKTTNESEQNARLRMICRALCFAAPTPKMFEICQEICALHNNLKIFNGDVQIKLHQDSSSSAIQLNSTPRTTRISLEKFIELRGSQASLFELARYGVLTPESFEPLFLWPVSAFGQEQGKDQQFSVMGVTKRAIDTEFQLQSKLKQHPPNWKQLYGSIDRLQVALTRMECITIENEHQESDPWQLKKNAESMLSDWRKLKNMYLFTLKSLEPELRPQAAVALAHYCDQLMHRVSQYNDRIKQISDLRMFPEYRASQSEEPFSTITGFDDSDHNLDSKILKAIRKDCSKLKWKCSPISFCMAVSNTKSFAVAPPPFEPDRSTVSSPLKESQVWDSGIKQLQPIAVREIEEYKYQLATLFI